MSRRVVRHLPGGVRVTLSWSHGNALFYVTMRRADGSVVRQARGPWTEGALASSPAWAHSEVVAARSAGRCPPFATIVDLPLVAAATAIDVGARP